MAACFSSAGVRSIPPIYVLSKIARLTDCLKYVATPDIEFKYVEIPDSFGKDENSTKECSDILKKIEIAVCDTDILVKTHPFMPSLKWAHSTWAGVENLLKAIPVQPSFTVTRHSGVSFTSLIAEYVICHILNIERLTKKCMKSQESKTWLHQSLFENSRSLDQITVGILGVGNMGSSIAEFLKSRGTKVIGLSRIPRPSGSCIYFDDIFTKLEDILPMCDYLCNTLPSTHQTNGMLNNSVLEKCERKPVFINVGRGNVISELELVKALRSKWISGAVLDVFENEPLPKTSELWDMEQVTITPHVAALSKPGDIAEDFIENLLKYIDGHGLQNVVNWEAGY